MALKKFRQDERNATRSNIIVALLGIARNGFHTSEDALLLALRELIGDLAQTLLGDADTASCTLE